MIRQMVEKGNPEKMCYLLTDNQLFLPEQIERYFTAYLTSELWFRSLQVRGVPTVSLFLSLLRSKISIRNA